nr:DUF2637 domain-containing protein [Streptomyces sp. DHE17-7]
MFNAAAAEGGVTGDPLGTAMHGVIPLLFIVAVEAARRAFVKASDTRDSQGVPLARWLLSPGRTAALWRRMKLWGTGSYQETVQIEQERGRLRRAMPRSIGGVGARARNESCCPERMAPYGLTAMKAYAWPAMRRKRAVRATRSRRLELRRARARACAERRNDRSPHVNVNRRAGEENAVPCARPGHGVRRRSGLPWRKARIRQKSLQAK